MEHNDIPAYGLWSLVIINSLVFIIFAAVGVYPIFATRYNLPAPKWLMDKQLKLGLDLQGGVHLVLRVQTDDALRHETEAESERPRESLNTAGMTGATITVDSPTRFKVEGIAAEQVAIQSTGFE